MHTTSSFWRSTQTLFNLVSEVSVLIPKICSHFFLERAVRNGNVRQTLFWARWYVNDSAIQEAFVLDLIKTHTSIYSANCIVAWIALSSEDLRNNMFARSVTHRSHYYSAALAEHATHASNTMIVELLRWNNVPLLALMATRHNCDIDFLAAASVVRGNHELFHTLSHHINFNQVVNHLNLSTYEWTTMHPGCNATQLNTIIEQANDFLCTVQHNRLSDTVQDALNNTDSVGRVKRRM